MIGLEPKILNATGAMARIPIDFGVMRDTLIRYKPALIAKAK